MDDLRNLTPNIISALSYPDFIGLINQWNTPPGALSTLSKFATFSNLNKKSRLLEVACSTGFTSRELARMTLCSGRAFDISKRSIEMANLNKKLYAPNIKIIYEVADGYEYKYSKKFTHISVGAGLKFFSDPKKMLNHCIALIEDSGYILASPYYEIHPMPKDLIRRTHKQLGIPMSAFNNFSYKEVIEMYRDFEIIFEERNELIEETLEEIQEYASNVVAEACKMCKITDDDIAEALYSRLVDLRLLINKGRRYQKYCVLVLRYRKSIFPKRLIPLY